VTPIPGAHVPRATQRVDLVARSMSVFFAKPDSFAKPRGFENESATQKLLQNTLGQSHALPARARLHVTREQSRLPVDADLVRASASEGPARDQRNLLKKGRNP
jgi:hypothetical protein